MATHTAHATLLMLETIPSTLEATHLQRLSCDLKNQAATLPSNRQTQFLMGRALLAELLYHQQAIEQLPAIIYQQNKPVFADQNYGHFNISHSAEHIAVVLSAEPIGLDLEKIVVRHNYLKIARYCFSEIENAWLLQQPEPMAAFFQLWTQREAILKLCGKGVWQMQQIMIDLNHAMIHCDFAQDIHCISYGFSDLMLSIAQHRLQAAPITIRTPWRITKQRYTLNQICSSTLATER